MVDIPEVTFSKDGFSESETKKIFADAGIDWPTRAERYAKLKGTIFEEIDGWHIDTLLDKYKNVRISPQDNHPNRKGNELISNLFFNKVT